MKVLSFTSIYYNGVISTRNLIEADRFLRHKTHILRFAS